MGQKQSSYSLAPHFCSATMELVQHYIPAVERGYLIICHQHQLGVGEKNYVLRDISAGVLQIFKLSGEDVFGRRKPDYVFLGIVLAQLKADEGLAGAGWVDYRSLARFGQHFYCRFVGYSVVSEQFNHPSHLRLVSKVHIN